MRSFPGRPLLLIATWATAFLVSGPSVQNTAPFLSFSAGYSRTLITELTVRPRIETDDKQVTLLDLCEQTDLPEDWKALFAGVEIGSAPKAGSEKQIDPEQLTAFIRHLIKSEGLDQNGVKIIIPEKITLVPRESKLTLSQIEDIYKQFILSKVPWNTDDITVHHVYCPDPPVLPGGNMTYEVVSTPHERFLGSIAVTIHFYVDGKRARSMQVSGRVDLYQDVVYSRNPLKRNDIVTENDIQLIRTNIADHPDRYATRVEEVVGKRLLSSVGLRQPISLRDLDKPLAVKRGNPVTILYRHQGLTLTTKGQAKEDGSEGDRIKVTNVDSKQTIYCRIIDSRTVEVMTDNQ